MSIYDPLSEALGIEPIKNPSYLKVNFPLDDELIQVYKSFWTGCKHSEETKKLIAIEATGRIKPEGWGKKHSELMTGKKHSNESKERRSIESIGSKNPMYGKKHNEENKLKIQMKLGHKIILNGIIYNSKREAAKKLGVSRPTIDNWLKKSGG